VAYNGKNPRMIKNERDDRHTVFLYFFVGGGLWTVEASNRDLKGEAIPAAVNSGLSP
jgi:hypothetical protein